MGGVSVKSFLMNQNNVAGLGNIYCSEILFDSGIHPEKNFTNLKLEEYKKILKSTKKILNQAKKDGEKLIIEMNEKFHKSSEIKKNLAETKITQMKETAIKEIRETSIRVAMNSVKKIITTSVDKLKLDNLFEENIKEVKIALKKINS